MCRELVVKIHLGIAWKASIIDHKQHLNARNLHSKSTLCYRNIDKLDTTQLERQEIGAVRMNWS